MLLALVSCEVVKSNTVPSHSRSSSLLVTGQRNLDFIVLESADISTKDNNGAPQIAQYT